VNRKVFRFHLKYLSIIIASPHLPTNVPVPQPAPVLPSLRRVPTPSIMNRSSTSIQFSSASISPTSQEPVKGHRLNGLRTASHDSGTRNKAKKCQAMASLLLRSRLVPRAFFSVSPQRRSTLQSVYCRDLGTQPCIIG